LRGKIAASQRGQKPLNTQDEKSTTSKAVARISVKTQQTEST
jgi:hypothetical protein